MIEMAEIDQSRTFPSAQSTSGLAESGRSRWSKRTIGKAPERQSFVAGMPALKSDLLPLPSEGRAQSFESSRVC
jgi:hypothetical protein